MDPSKKNVLENLLEFYVYEFSPYLNIEVSEEGKYGFDQTNAYISEEHYDSFFIVCEKNLAGFVVVKKEQGCSYDYSMEQFFVLKKYNGKGIGKKAAFEAFASYKGKWQITQTETNYPAQAFWRGVIKEYTNNDYTECYDERRRAVQQFYS